MFGRAKDGSLYMLLQVALILNYICVLVLKTCDPPLEHMSIIEEERVAKAICSSYGLGDTASGEGGRRRRRRKVLGFPRAHALNT